MSELVTMNGRTSASGVKAFHTPPTRASPFASDMDDTDDPWAEPLEAGCPRTLGVEQPFSSSEAFFGWLRDHLVAEGHLTGAEEEICELLLLGRNYLEMAAVRHVTVETIKWHVKQILRKLRVDSTRELLWVVGYRIDRNRPPS